MRPQQPNDRAVTWEELFFDLAFVFALTQLAHLLHEDHGWAGAGRVLILFVTIYWIWGGTGLYTDQQNVAEPSGRIVILTLGFASLLLGITIPDAYGDRGLLFVSVALSARILLGSVTLRNVPAWRGFVLSPHRVIVVTAPMLLTGALAEGTTRIVLWAIAAAIDVSSSWLARDTVGTIRVQARHYVHRYGLLIIIVLGESVIQVGTVSIDHPLTPIRLLALAAAYTLAAALWWTYFGYGVHDFRWALERSADQGQLRRSVLVYGHLVFSLAIIAVADGLSDVVVEPVEALDDGEMIRLFGGCGLFLGTFAYTHWRIHREIVWRRLGVAAACFVLLPLATLLPALAALAVLLLLVGGLAVLEELFRRRHPARPEDAEFEQMDPGPVTNE
ncbi:low temperature requirement protein A [Plantactinospora sp. WMMB782]|uniref:low temperature requirement protein A n=1 Tax=Plantactinospora sp. WMMB782 TaxID=3404121 RepID=UPI003B955358